MYRLIYLFFVLFFCIWINVSTDSTIPNYSEEAQIENLKQIDDGLTEKKEEPRFDVILKKSDKNWKPIEHYEDLYYQEKAFDASLVWRNCPSIGRRIFVPDSKNGWAVASCSAFSDRLCIATNGKFNEALSYTQLMESCTDCSTAGGFGKKSLEKAWTHFQNNGAITVNIYEAIKNGTAVYDNDNTIPRWKTKNVYKINLAKIQFIQAEISTYGPVTAVFKNYENFKDYRRYGTVYNQKNRTGTFEPLAVKIFGWGFDKYLSNYYKSPYWLCIGTQIPGWYEPLRLPFNFDIDEVIAGVPSNWPEPPQDEKPEPPQPEKKKKSSLHWLKRLLCCFGRKP